MKSRRESGRLINAIPRILLTAALSVALAAALILALTAALLGGSREFMYLRF